MPYFGIKSADCKNDVCVCKAEKIEDIDPDSFLGTVKIWEIREIDTTEAEILLHKLTPNNMPTVKLEDLVRCVSMKLSDTPFGD